MEKIVVKDISMKYHDDEVETVAISKIGFHLNEGEFISIIGPSGCGKSTLLSIISNLIKPTSGEIIINGDKTIGYMLQKDHLFEWRSILSNVCLGLEVQKKLSKENITFAESLLEKYGLSEFKKRRPSQLSGGMRQRVALIRTLATKPDILLLDEPFSALDYQTRLYVAGDIEKILRKEKKSVILVTHDISEAVSFSDRVIVLSKRPATIANIHEIKLSKENCSAREAPEFSYYFNLIRKELGINV